MSSQDVRRPDPGNRSRTVAVRPADAPRAGPDNGAPYTGRLSRPHRQPGDRRRPRWWTLAAAALLLVGAAVWGPGLYSHFHHPAPVVAVPTTKLTYGTPVVSAGGCAGAERSEPPAFTVSLDGGVVLTYSPYASPSWIAGHFDAAEGVSTMGLSPALDGATARLGAFVVAADPTHHVYQFVGAWPRCQP